MNTYVKFASAALIYAALLALVFAGKIDASVFVTLATAGLSALGIHAAITTPYPGNPTQPGPSA